MATEARRRPPPLPQRPPSRTRPAGGRRRFSARVATVAGIDIRVHATFLLLVGLVALASTAPDGPDFLPGVAWLLALFGGVVVHELAHSLVARHHGITTVEIELLPIGGVSKMTRTAEDPRVQLRIAAAGPAASIGVAAVCAALTLLTGDDLWPPDLTGGDFLARLTWVNLLLAGFNLLPAFPMDGGRVLRALLEPRTGPARATVVAARVGRAMAVLMVTAGLVVNVWLVLIGLFVWFGGRGEEAAAAVHERLKDVHVADVMVREPVVVPASAVAARSARPLWRTGQGAFPVVGDDGAYVGLVSADELLRAPASVTVGELADRAARTLDPDDGVEASGLLSGELEVAAVVRSGRVVGLAAGRDASTMVERLLRSLRATGRLPSAPGR